MEDDNEDDLKNKEELHIAGKHTVLDISCFAVFFGELPNCLSDPTHPLSSPNGPYFYI